MMGTDSGPPGSDAGMPEADAGSMRMGDDEDRGGCGCEVPGRSPSRGSFGALLVLGLIGAWFARRRTRVSR
jgi:MYXO-CTERM domain-containing protein